MRRATMTYGLLGLLTLALVFGGTVWVGVTSLRREASVDATVPSARMPVPNGYDLYIDAGRAVVERDRVRETAAALRPAAISSFAGRFGTASGNSSFDWAGSVPTKEMRSLLDRNQGVLAAIRKGLASDCWNAAGRDNPADRAGAQSPLDRALDLLTLQGKVRTCDGDWSGAAEAFVDMLEVECDITRGGGLYETQFSARRQWRPRRYVWQLLPRLDAQAARQAARRVEKISARMPSFADVLVEHKYAIQRLLLDMMEESGWRQVIVGHFEDARGRDVLAEKARARSIGKRELFDTYTESMDLAIIRAQKPYPLRGPRLPISRDLFYYWLWHEDGDGDYDLRMEWEYARASNGLLAVGLALRAYQAERGRYPESLGELVPSILSRLPNDPFAVKGTFRYRLTGSGYLLYSLGPNSRDDDGRPMTGRFGSRRSGTRGRGDLLAGEGYY